MFSNDSNSKLIIVIVIVIVIIVIVLVIVIIVSQGVHPVSITRFSLRIFSPGAGLLRNPFVQR